MNHKLKDLTGQRFGLLVVVRRAENIDQESGFRVAWLTRCDCGKEEVVIARYLTRGDKKACVKCTTKANPTTPLKDALEKIEKLETRLKYALSELKEERETVDFYANEKNWESTRVRNDFNTEARIIVDETLYVGGLFARERKLKRLSV